LASADVAGVDLDIRSNAPRLSPGELLLVRPFGLVRL
jgi:hypothetical protein